MSQCPRLRWAEETIVGGAKQWTTSLLHAPPHMGVRTWTAVIYFSPTRGKFVLQTTGRDVAHYSRLDVAKNIARERAQRWWSS